MSRVQLRFYLEKMIDKYNDSRERCAVVWDALDTAKKENGRIQAGRQYSTQGKREAQEHYREKERAAKNELANILKDAQGVFAEIRNEVDHQYSHLYSIRPEQVDTNALELLKSGVLTDKEIVSFGDLYASNPAMSRLVGKYAAQRSEKAPGNTELRRIAANGQLSHAPHLEAVDTLTMLAEHGLRPDRLYADGTAKIFDESAANILSEYGNICNE